jgi:hypothetical protein
VKPQRRGAHSNHLPIGKPIYGRVEPQSGDERYGDYTRKQLLRMNERFVAAMERELRRGAEGADRREQGIATDQAEDAGGRRRM